MNPREAGTLAASDAMKGNMIPGDEPRPEPEAAMTGSDAAGSDAAMPGLRPGQDPLGATTHPPGKTGRRPRRFGRNDLIRRARLAIASASGSGRPMSRQELADAVNAYLHARGVQAQMNQDLVGCYERGDTRWPGEHYRRGLRAVLGAETDAQLGLFKPHPRPSEDPGPADDPGGDPAAVAAADLWVAGAIAPPVVSLPGPTRRVVLHWTGGKAYALRIAMRMGVSEFAAKLGVAHSVVSEWRPEATGRLRFETHQMLDAMLSAATDDDVLRFDLALQEIGESR